MNNGNRMRSSKSYYRLFFVYLNVLLMCSNVLADDNECRPWQPEDGRNKNLIIGKITLKAGDIFDLSNPDENHHINRLANKLHIQTRDEVLRRQLLFTSGDTFDARLLNETTRLLRANSYIKDVIITPEKICGNKVNIKVYTTDNWTLTPSVSLGRSGGVNTSSAKIQEHNLFGYGKELKVSYKSAIDRDNSLLSYYDPLFMGTRKVLSVSAQDNTDGEAYNFDYALPFYQLDSRKSWGVNSGSKRQETTIYNNGSESYKLGVKANSTEIFYGWSGGVYGISEDTVGNGLNHNITGKVIRYRAGWRYDSQKFTQLNGPPLVQKIIDQSYPWIEAEYFQEDYIQKSNLRSMGIIEDVSLGHHLVVRVGLLNKTLGSSNNYLNLSGSYSKGYIPARNQLALLDVSANTYMGNGALKGGLFQVKGEWYLFQNKRNNFYVSGKYKAATNLLEDQQIRLGGDTGLRGYPLRIQSGDKAFLISVEQRHFFDWYPYKLFQVGVAVFADTGSAWGTGNKMNILSDVGFGFRLVSTRSTGASVVHIDFAFPLENQNNIDSFQVLIGAKKSL